MPVVLAPGWPGILLHEAVGHGLEADFNRKGLSAFSGRRTFTAWNPDVPFRALKTTPAPPSASKEKAATHPGRTAS